MTSLLNVEKSFQDYLLHANPDIFHHVIGTSKVPVDVRLGIYGQAYRSRLHEALMTSYSVMHSYLGDEEFETLCYAYIDSHPSPYRSIRWFGDQLATFLQHYPPYTAYPYLAELAQFEWTLALVFDAADSRVIQLEEIQTIPPEAWADMRLKAHPSTHCLSLNWNVVQIWQAITEDHVLPEPQQNTGPLDWIVWRTDFMSQFSSLTTDEAWAINAMMDNHTFEELCEGLCQWIDEDNVGMHAASLLKGWITSGLIVEVLIDF